MYDCTGYSDQELDMLVNNDEFLYKQRFSLTRELLKEYGVNHTDDQWEYFKNELENEED